MNYDGLVSVKRCLQKDIQRIFLLHAVWMYTLDCFCNNSQVNRNSIFFLSYAVILITFIV